MALDIAAALSRGYISMDAADALSTFMTNGMPDRARFLNFLGNLIVTAADAERKSKLTLQFSQNVFISCGHKETPRQRYGSKDSGTKK